MIGRLPRCLPAVCRFTACCFALSILSAARGTEPLSPERIDTIIEALSRLGPEKVEANPKLKEALANVLEATRGTPQFVELVREFKIKDQDAALVEVAVRNSNSGAGADAARLLLENKAYDLIKSALNGTNATKFAEALGNTADRQAVPLLEPIVGDSGRDAALRRQAVRSLALTQEGATALLKLATESRLPDDLKLTAATELHNVRWAELKAQAEQVLPPPQSRNAESLPPVSELVKRTGDANRGAAVFRRDTVGCVRCHQINGEGVDFGPNLSEIGTKLGKDAIYESILDPSAGISFGYEAWQIELQNGDEVFGLIASETADEVAVKIQTGVVNRYKKSDVVKREKQKLSIMPAGLQQTMSTQDLVDLVEYLSLLKKAVQ